jgi:hypothetical protein
MEIKHERVAMVTAIQHEGVEMVIQLERIEMGIRHEGVMMMIQLERIEKIKVVISFEGGQHSCWESFSATV